MNELSCCVVNINMESEVAGSSYEVIEGGWLMGLQEYSVRGMVDSSS